MSGSAAGPSGEMTLEVSNRNSPTTTLARILVQEESRAALSRSQEAVCDQWVLTSFHWP